MAIARIATFPAGTKEQYEYLGQLMGEGVADQPERRVLASGPSKDGWTIIQIWESQEALERFIADHLRPAMERAGDRGYPEPPLITDIELADLYL
jgi:hypothetical protein